MKRLPIQGHVYTALQVSAKKLLSIDSALDRVDLHGAGRCPADGAPIEQLTAVPAHRHVAALPEHRVRRLLQADDARVVAAAASAGCALTCAVSTRVPGTGCSAASLTLFEQAPVCLPYAIPAVTTVDMIPCPCLMTTEYAGWRSVLEQCRSLTEVVCTAAGVRLLYCRHQKAALLIQPEAECGLMHSCEHIRLLRSTTIENRAHAHRIRRRLREDSVPRRACAVSSTAPTTPKPTATHENVRDVLRCIQPSYSHALPPACSGHCIGDSGRPLCFALVGT